MKFPHRIVWFGADVFAKHLGGTVTGDAHDVIHIHALVVHQRGAGTASGVCAHQRPFGDP